MKRRTLIHKFSTAFLTFTLVFSMAISPVTSMTGFAQDTESTEENSSPESTPEIPDSILETDGSENTAAGSKAPADLAAPSVKDSTLPEQEYPVKLVYGDEKLPNEDAFVLLIFGDGFTEKEQDKFFEESRKTAEYVMATSPYDEFTDTIKIYAMGVISNESGARADKAQNQEQADADTRDTYFKTSFWSGGMQRLLSVGSEGMAKVRQLQSAKLPAADFNVIMVNSETYGGSGGSVCVASLNAESLEMMLHELGHTVANLADEYFAGPSYAHEYANMTAESDPAKVKWSRFIGKNGVGVYEYDNGGDGWYRPHENCKMRFLGKQYDFCEVCKEALRRTFSKKSNKTKMFYQQYADVLFEDGNSKDMSEYFILRKGSNEAVCNTLDSGFSIEYKDSNGNTLDSAPSKAGHYTAIASFAGNDTYDNVTLKAEFDIELPDLITLKVNDKVYDGNPAELDYDVNYDKPYEVKAHYTGAIPYSTSVTNSYDSDEAPVVPGRYNVTLTVYDKADNSPISIKSADYKIDFKTTTIYNHDTNSYPGAMPYYNNKTIVFTGEGFTADEQDKFEEIAKEYVEYFRNTEPFKEADLYFNYHAVEAVSQDSGVSTSSNAKDTYFSMSLDENGKLVPCTDAYKDSRAGAAYIGYYIVTAYYQSTVVIVNDDAVKENTAVKDKRVTVFAGKDKKDMDFAAKELLNYFTGQEIGYRAESESEIETQRNEFLKSLYYFWYGTSYAPVLSRAYDETFVEDGTAFDLSQYFNTYVLDKPVPDVSYTMTYYTDNNGVLGEKLDSAPSKAGKYFALAELNMDEGKNSKIVTVDGESYTLPRARGLTSYTIQPVKDDNNGGSGNDKPDDNNKPNPDNTNKPNNKPGTNDKNNKVQTGDSSPVVFYSVIGIVALAAIAALLYRRRFKII